MRRSRAAFVAFGCIGGASLVRALAHYLREHLAIAIPDAVESSGYTVREGSSTEYRSAAIEVSIAPLLREVLPTRFRARGASESAELGRAYRYIDYWSLDINPDVAQIQSCRTSDPNVALGRPMLPRNIAPGLPVRGAVRYRGSYGMVVARGKHTGPPYADSLVVAAPRVQLSRKILRFIK